MIPTYFFALPILRHFPTCLFHGVFLFLAYSNTIGNEFFQRMLLLFTEQVIPPLKHNPFFPFSSVPIPRPIIFDVFLSALSIYLRVNSFLTILISFILLGTEFLQFALLLAIGHFPWPIIRLIFPLALIIFIPLRSNQ